ncbi:MAG: STAS-like domain-containing protein [Puniceicoccales bacterium]|jgi:hypothetical protein|nr:STAS-like domain-containing protein [Puniceicoccales bacterium]
MRTRKTQTTRAKTTPPVATHSPQSPAPVPPATPPVETKIRVRDEAGAFAENKDIARKLRVERVLTALQNGGAVEFDFAGVTGATQSFVHALVADVLRRHGERAMDNLFYKNCAPVVKEVIATVYEYVQESAEP